MALPSRRLSLVKDALDIVLRRLSVLPASPEVDRLRAKAGEYLGEADRWSKTSPMVEERERLMKRVLGLHVELAKLERDQGPGRTGQL